MTTTASKRLGVGIVGAGEVFQVCHGPCLFLMSHLFSIESVCDISRKNADFCAAKWHIPQATTDPRAVFSNPSVDVVFVLTSDDSHTPLAVAALQAGKHVMLEKPVALSIPSAQQIIDAERASPGRKRVFVGYMRRYAPSYLGAFKRELATMPRISYARVRDFSGPNAYFVDGSGTFQAKNNDFPPNAGAERDARLEDLFRQAFPGQEITDEHRRFCRFLGSLGSHDLSLLRETLGSPESIAGVSANDPFYSTIMNYRNKDGTPFSVTYESGIDEIPIFDAHIAVYSARKRVWIQYDSPYVKGLPIKVHVEEVNDQGEPQKREILCSYKDAYTCELEQLHACLVDGKEIKTSVTDALEDLKLFDMLYKKWQSSRTDA
ncbi:Uu.00g002380.m01.CDS01 [Anthostomella pinea]|uniref:Uu.00g002380.m01.CDS01 n=1 Tax=Anthostomella pinea TaxID=933095 RepID=A0AAI8YIR1_9PEZI|nr:Uu.00g002380.m01.CDS01 [Anthostomella pinea]